MTQAKEGVSRHARRFRPLAWTPGFLLIASGAPYFHNGFASTLVDVVEFYNSRFNIGLTPSEKEDLVAFLAAL